MAEVLQLSVSVETRDVVIVEDMIHSVQHRYVRLTLVWVY
jgi:hypothetical protein